MPKLRVFFWPPEAVANFVEPNTVSSVCASTAVTFHSLLSWLPDSEIETSNQTSNIELHHQRSSFQPRRGSKNKGHKEKPPRHSLPGGFSNLIF